MSPNNLLYKIDEDQLREFMYGVKCDYHNYDCPIYKMQNLDLDCICEISDALEQLRW